VLIWAAERPERDALVVPEGVELASVPPQPGDHPDLPRVEVLVPPYRSRRVLSALPGMAGLRLVQALESGVEWLLPHVPDGVTVCNSRGAHDVAVAEWVVGVVLAVQRKLPEHLDAQRQGLWRDIVAEDEWGPPFAGDLEGATVLIVGHGSIGTAVERRLEPFGVDFLRVARGERPGVQPVSALPSMIPDADVVIVLVPLTPDTEGLVDASLIGAMKPGALLINAGRGRLVDQEALTEALYDGRIRAALDVTDPEPLPAGDRLWTAPNLLLTPHMAGDTPRRYRRSWEIVGEQVERLLEGRPLENVVKR
jgi:phosphoglycerate dehydrogenase-like enzyme